MLQVVVLVGLPTVGESEAKEKQVVVESRITVDYLTWSIRGCQIITLSDDH